jgi:putative FmdB family regulatory protein
MESATSVPAALQSSVGARYDARMPIYEYACRSCEHRFEELVSSYGTLVACPQCTSAEVEKLLSTFSARTAGGQPALRAPVGGGGGCCGGGCGCRH